MIWSLHHGEAWAWLRSLPDASADALVTDPPYSSGGFTRGDRSADPSTKYRASGAAESTESFSGDTRSEWECLAWLEALRRARCPGSGQPIETAEQIRRDRDALRADCARISAELGLPPRIGPAPGELARLVGDLRALCREAAAWIGEQPGTEAGHALYLRLRAAGGES